MDETADIDDVSAELVRTARSGRWWRLCELSGHGSWGSATPSARDAVVRELAPFLEWLWRPKRRCHRTTSDQNRPSRLGRDARLCRPRWRMVIWRRAHG